MLEKKYDWQNVNDTSSTQVSHYNCLSFIHVEKSFRNLYLYKINSILYYVIKDDHFM